jgi:hypothetical protein
VFPQHGSSRGRKEKEEMADRNKVWKVVAQEAALWYMRTQTQDQPHIEALDVSVEREWDTAKIMRVRVFHFKERRPARPSFRVKVVEDVNDDWEWRAEEITVLGVTPEETVKLRQAIHGECPQGWKVDLTFVRYDPVHREVQEELIRRAHECRCGCDSLTVTTV